MALAAGIPKRCVASPEYASGLTGVDLFSRPVPRHEVIEAVDLMICDAGENPAKSCFGIDTVQAAGLNERISDGSSVAASF